MIKRYLRKIKVLILFCFVFISILSFSQCDNKIAGPATIFLGEKASYKSSVNGGDWYVIDKKNFSINSNVYFDPITGFLVGNEVGEYLVLYKLKECKNLFVFQLKIESKN
jgi:hypothetical protein